MEEKSTDKHPDAGDEHEDANGLPDSW